MISSTEDFMCWRRCANASQIHLFKIHSSFIHTSNFGSTKGIWSGREKTPAVQLFFSSSSLYWESAYFSLSSQSTLNSHQRPSHWGTLCKQEAWATLLRQKVNTDAIALLLSGECCANRDEAGFGSGKSSSTHSLKVRGFTPGFWISARETRWAG